MGPIPILGVLAGVLALPMLGAASEPLMTGIRQLAYNALPTQLSPEQVFVTLHRRKLISTEIFRSAMRHYGYKSDQARNIELADEFYPTPSDLVMWQAKEVYEPKAVERYGLDAELEDVEQLPFRKAGVNEEQTRNFWRAHWQHPPFNQLMEMLHRDVLASPTARDEVKAGSDEWAVLRDEEIEQAYEWYKLVEIPPHWRSRLTEIAYNPLTRVDARRMWDMGVLDDEELLRAYLDLGYNLLNARRMVTWTKVYQDYPDLVQAFKNGWMSTEEVMARLIEFGMTEERATFLFRTKFSNLAKPARVARERDLTRAEITKAVKKEILDPETALSLLERMGYDKDEAKLVLEIHTNWQESPETPLDFLKGVEALRRAEGLDAIDIPPELDGSDSDYADASTHLAMLISSGADDAEIAKATRRADMLRRRVAKVAALSPGVPKSVETAYAR